MGLDASAVFTEFDDAPLGAASIGQVHRAVLAPEYGGQEVVVKVQAPGIERRFRADIKVPPLSPLPSPVPQFPMNPTLKSVSQSANWPVNI